LFNRKDLIKYFRSNIYSNQHRHIPSSLLRRHKNGVDNFTERKTEERVYVLEVTRKMSAENN